MLLASFFVACALPATALAVGFTTPHDLATGDNPRAIAVGDFNGDADPDLAVVNNSSHNVSVLVGAGASSFGAPVNYGAGTYPSSVAIGDFNADGDPDLAVANTQSDDVSILLGGTGATFGTATSFFGGDFLTGIAVGEFSGDSDPDLAVTSQNGDTAGVLLGGTAGSFGAPASYTIGDAVTGVAVADFNADTDPDIVTSNQGSSDVSVLLGSTGSNFLNATNVNVGLAPTAVAVGDFNADGDPDLAVPGWWMGGVAVLLGGSGSSFSAPTILTTGVGTYTGIAVGDLSGDGDPDLAVANGNEPVIRVFEGAAGGSFGPVQSFRVTGPTNAIAIGDFNADGDLDIVAANSNLDSVSVLLNTAHAPPAPTFTDTDPDSPANDNAPRIKGQAEAGTTVRLYTTSDCTGTPAATGTAAEFTSPGLQVAVPDDSQTSFFATTTNGVDVPSACSSSSISYIEASNPPQVSLSASPNPALTGALVTFTATAVSPIPVTGYVWDLDGDGTFETDTGASPSATRSFTAPGDLNPAVRASNNIGPNEARTGLSIRLAPPAGRVGASINGGALFTNDPDVTVSLVWPPLARDVLFSNDGGFAAPGSFAVAPERSWRLARSGPERLPKTVYVRFDDSTQTFSDDIILDETDPVVGAATATGSRAQATAAARKRSYKVRVTARDATSGVTALQVTSNKRQPGRLRAYGRTTRFKKTVRFTTSSSRIYVRVRDAAGNYSRWRKAVRPKR